MILKKYNLDEFLATKKKIVCYGAGVYLKRICEYVLTNFFDRIDLIIDNNKEVFECQSKRKNTIKLVDFNSNNYNLEDYIILLTMRDFVDVYEELDSIFELKNVECCIYHALFLDEMKKSCEMPDNTGKEQKIPKKIHYVWVGGNELPDKYKRNIETWHKYNPDYEIIRWDESNYDITKNQYMYDAYKAKKWGFVSDYMRIDIIYNEGGIYLDTDIEVVKNFDDLLYDDAFFGLMFAYCCFQAATGLGFGAVKGHPFIRKYMDLYSNIEFIENIDDFVFNYVPLIDNVFQNKFNKLKNRLYKYDKIVIYPQEVFSPIERIVNIPIAFTKNTYSIHEGDYTWKDSRLEYFEKLNKITIFYKKNSLI